ncbi:predicted protein [Histoplasma capsulatum G186AR]|uniref:Uncharacterized protein n=1 Tax=Ajellomyces capsulatus (strain G186AR / H82 / ATCC MYA-2454 / RMSCC 2432) TaxID=447093 RepID=C0NMZ1_AJECG|nr:uncharacterized protein HCBG_04118 [Histoplasma capsulatum G186AR]EEH07239.1 predicted protein [Histoplasma capsulatum G186AR]
MVACLSIQSKLSQEGRTRIMEGSWKHNGQGVANNSQLKTSSKRLNCTTGVLTTATGWNLTQFRSGGCTFETNLAGLAFEGERWKHANKELSAIGAGKGLIGRILN